ncbi:unnamed protein product [Alternaria alternata]
MTTTSILFLVLTANTLAHQLQKPLSSLDLSKTSYQCDNGVKPSIICNDASEKHNCSCTCTNGIKFDQPLDPFSATASGDSGTGHDTECLAAKNFCLEREQQLMVQVADLTDGQQKSLKREQELLEQLRTYQNTYAYQGCFTDSIPRVLNARETNESAMTLERCETICQGYKYYGLQYGSYCFCGNTFVNPTQQVAETNCNMACAGNGKQMCGAAGHNSVYAKVA